MKINTRTVAANKWRHNICVIAIVLLANGVSNAAEPQFTLTMRIQKTRIIQGEPIYVQSTITNGTSQNLEWQAHGPELGYFWQPVGEDGVMHEYDNRGICALPQPGVSVCPTGGAKSLGSWIVYNYNEGTQGLVDEKPVRLDPVSPFVNARRYIIVAAYIQPNGSRVGSNAIEIAVEASQGRNLEVWNMIHSEKTLQYLQSGRIILLGNNEKEAEIIRIN